MDSEFVKQGDAYLVEGKAMGPANRALVDIVEDDEGVRCSLGMLVESQGWKAREFSSAFEYLERLAHSETRPVCLILDLQMPDMNGVELLEALRGKDFDMPVIVLTAWPEGRLAEQARRIGVCRIMGKPFDASEWIGTLEGIVKHDRQCGGNR